METIWFWLVAFMIAAYVVLDGFDLGAGILHLLIARTEPERQVLLLAIGPDRLHATLAGRSQWPA